MSVDALSWALKRAEVSDPQAALILIGLADHAHDDGTCAWPSQATLARYARCTDRTVRNRLVDLETAGLIRRGDQAIVAHLPSNRRPVVWDLALGGTPFRPERGAVLTGTPRSSDRNVRSDKPSFEPNTEPSKNTTLRASRIPDPFPITGEMVEWARTACPGMDHRASTERFVDYWRAKAGRDATKLDWPATWRNWMRTDYERTPQQPRPGRPSNGYQPSTAEVRAGQAMNLAAKYRAMENTERTEIER